MKVVLALAACGRSVSIVDDFGGGGGSAWSPDSADSGGAPANPWAGTSTSDQACEEPVGALPDDLLLDWCERVSPEPDQAWPGEDPGARCGFFNLTGAFGARGVDAPTLMYCDADLEGGLRFGRYDAAGAVFASRLVWSGGCSGWPGSGALVEVDGEEWLGAMPAVDDGGALQTVRLGGDGTVRGGPAVHDTRSVGKVALSASTPRLAAFVDADQGLWSMPLSDDGMTAGAPVFLDNGAYEVALTEAGGEILVATCRDGRVDVLGLDRATGVQSWSYSPPGSDCEFYQRPGLVGLADGAFVVTWMSLDDLAMVSIVDADRQQVARLDLGTAPRAVTGAQVAAANDTFLVVASNGTGVVLDPRGTELARFRHAAIAAHEDLSALGLSFDGARATFAPVWGSLIPVGVHSYVYDVIELSSARVVP